MLIRIVRAGQAREAEVTDEALYLRRREFLRQGALGLGAAAGALWLPACGRADDGRAPGADALTPFEDASSYNNFYELGTDKGDPRRNAGSLRVRPWSVEVLGQVARPGTYALDDLLRDLAREERIYRLRCVEAWSMVIPWRGVPLARVLERLGPEPGARFVEFRTLLDPEQLPGQRSSVLDWPYREGLRMDEAMHPLSLLATGMYGRDLPGQNGAPLRLVVPWKYGFKSIKSIVSIRFSAGQPPTTWSMEAPHEYGFYANVNPDVDHPRWSQKRERRIGELRRRPTLPFNGYADEVASLYAGMDLRANF